MNMELEVLTLGQWVLGLAAFCHLELRSNNRMDFENMPRPVPQALGGSIPESVLAVKRHWQGTQLFRMTRYMT